MLLRRRQQLLCLALLVVVSIEQACARPVLLRIKDRLLSQVEENVDQIPHTWPVSTEEVLKPLPAVKSQCRPGLFTKPYAIVVAGNFHDHTWLEHFQGNAEIVVYQTTAPDQPNYFTGFAHEAQAYLRFLVDYYDCMPEAVAFIHGHSESWHSKPMLSTLKALRWGSIPGYTDLNRQMPVWWQNMQRTGEFPEEAAGTGADAFNGSFAANQVFGGVAYDAFNVGNFMLNRWFRHAYDVFFGHVLKGPIPYKIHFVCCAQFAVTRERIHARDQMFWRLNLHYLHNNDIMATTRFSKTYIVGDIFSYLWPMLMGESPDYVRSVPDEELFPGADVNKSVKAP